MKVVGLALVASLSACGDNQLPIPTPPVVETDAPPPTFGMNVEMTLVALVPSLAVLVTSPPNDGRLFVVERYGQIRVIENGLLLDEPFLDLSADVNGPVLTDAGELGLLGLAFHPQYATTGVFFVSYTAHNSGDPLNEQRDVVSRCTVSATDPNRARGTCIEILSIPDLASNHNGGMIEFGADGYLYLGTGDGGSGNPNNPQALEDALPNTRALLGKILRLDIDHPAPGLEYGIPLDNPYAAGGGRPEIWIRGLRNPWRWSFDRMTGDIWIGDVGQKQFEELNVLRPSQQPGANLGWKFWEGSLCYEGDCSTSQVLPKDERPRFSGWYSIIAGQVYRGSRFPDLQGWHFYTDHYKGGLAMARLEDDDTLTVFDLPGSYPANLTSIHEAAGELYATDATGKIFQLVVAP
ncbi:MAG: PQQ-dependent sugar dehydrogenase [Deltaproteobacteria bacterium]|nr:PQQ-dependent sugar dehydrogenase [Deltaproteobacteria bacterium]